MSTEGIETENVKMGNQGQCDFRGTSNRAHSRVYMPSVLSFCDRSRTDVRSLTYLSASSTSSSRSISKLTGAWKTMDISNHEAPIR